MSRLFRDDDNAGRIERRVAAGIQRERLQQCVAAMLLRELDGRIEQRDFVAGFELDEDVIGRPVDVAEGSGGVIYLSDDYAGAIYRIEPVGR